MSFLYLTGSAFNGFARGTVTASPSAATGYSASNIGNSDPSEPLIFGSLSADSYCQVTINALTNPGFETSTLSGWTAGSAGTGTSAETTTAGEFRSGSKALKLTGTDSSNYGSRYQSITANAGEYRKSLVYIKTTSSGTGKLFIRNLKTGNYYNGSAWASTRAAAVSQAATGSFVSMSVTYQVEDFDTCRDDTVSIRIEYACESGTVCFDDGLEVFGVTWASIHGHNLGPVVPTVRSSDDGSSWTDRGTITLKRGACFTTFSVIYAEYWRIVLVGTNHETPYLGECVIGQYQTCATSPKWDLSDTKEFPGVRTKGPAGRFAVYNYATQPTQGIKLTFSARSSTAAKELSDSLWLRSGQGRYPVIVAPIDTESDVFFGRVVAQYQRDRPFQGVYDSTLEIVGDPFPTVGL